MRMSFKEFQNLRRYEYQPASLRYELAGAVYVIALRITADNKLAYFLSGDVYYDLQVAERALYGKLVEHKTIDPPRSFEDFQLTRQLKSGGITYDDRYLVHMDAQSKWWNASYENKRTSSMDLHDVEHWLFEKVEGGE